MWVYYIVKYVTKTASANLGNDPRRVPHWELPLSPVFVRSFNPVLLLLLVVWGGRWGRGGGRGAEHFLWCLSEMKELIVTTKIILQVFFSVLFALFVCSLASELFTLLMFFSSLKISGLRQKSIVTTLLSPISWEYNAILSRLQQIVSLLMWVNIWVTNHSDPATASASQANCVYWDAEAKPGLVALYDIEGQPSE